MRSTRRFRVRSPDASAFASADDAPRSWGMRVQTRQTQHQLKEEVLYETAARWFNRRGFRGTSLSDLASELGVTKAALYHYVHNKRELLYRLHMKSLNTAQLARDRAVKEGRDGLERLTLLIYYYVSAITASPTDTFILLEDGALEQKQAKEIIERRRRLERDVRALIRQGVEDGSIIPCDPKLTAYIVIGAHNLVSRWYRPGGSWDGNQIATAISMMFERMLCHKRCPELPQDVSAIKRRDEPDTKLKRAKGSTAQHARKA